MSGFETISEFSINVAFAPTSREAGATMVPLHPDPFTSTLRPNCVLVGEYATANSGLRTTPAYRDIEASCSRSTTTRQTFSFLSKSLQPFSFNQRWPIGEREADPTGKVWERMVVNSAGKVRRRRTYHNPRIHCSSENAAQSYRYRDEELARMKACNTARAGAARSFEILREKSGDRKQRKVVELYPSAVPLPDRPSLVSSEREASLIRHKHTETEWLQRLGEEAEVRSPLFAVAYSPTSTLA
ncbi:hypothetical protein C8J57DRAFT_1240801 [Mycena rebaudengoi]|nr:hypothetical protein C8J57DRAFT_1240801 [Mycena rebaudengoi]